MVNIAAVTAKSVDGFPALEVVLHAAGFTGLKFKQKDDRLDSFER